jgi:transposase
MSYSQIAKCLKVTKNIVGYQIRRWKEKQKDSAMCDQQVKKSKLNEAHCGVIRGFLRQNQGREFSIRALRDYLIKHEPQVHVALATLWGFIRDKLQLRFGLSKLQARLSNTYLNKTKRKIIALKMIELINGKFNMIFLDETSLNQDKIPRRAWMRMDEKYAIVQPSRRKNLSLLLAFDLMGNYCFEVQEQTYNQNKFKDFLENLVEVLRNRTRKTFIIFMDNASFHKTEPVLKFLNDNDVKCIFNAPYSPQLNPIETCFGFLKRWLRRKGAFER